MSEELFVKNLGVIKNIPEFDDDQLNGFEEAIGQLRSCTVWDKRLIANEFFKIVPEFVYHDNGKYLNDKM